MGAVADAPGPADLAPALRGLRGAGYSYEEVEVTCARLGDATARQRRVVLAVRGGGEDACIGQENVEPMSVRSCVGKLRPDIVRLGSEEGELVLDPRIPRRGGRFGAKPCGHWHPAGGGTKELRLRGGGPCPEHQERGRAGQARGPHLGP